MIEDRNVHICLGAGAFCEGVKRPRHEAGHMPLSSQCEDCMALYLHSPQRLQCVMLN